MKMLQYTMLTLIILILLPKCYSQYDPELQPAIDSMKRELNKEFLEDTTRLNLLVELATTTRVMRISFWDTIVSFSDEALPRSPNQSVTNRLIITKGEALANIGYIHLMNNDIDQSLKYYEDSKDLFEEAGYIKGIASYYLCIGFIFKRTGDHKKALKYLELSLKIRREIGDNEGIAGSLSNLAGIYLNYGNIEKAKEYYRAALKLIRTFNDKRQLASELANLAYIFKFQGSLDSSMYYYEQSLEINKQIGNKQGISNCLGHIGLIFMKKGDLITALDYYKKGLKLNKEIEYITGIAASLSSIASIYLEQGDVASTIKNYNEVVDLYTSIGDLPGLATIYNNFGIVYCMEGDTTLAMKYYAKALNIEEKLGIEYMIANSLNNIANIYEKRNKPKQALNNYERALVIHKKHGDKNGIVTCLSNIGGVYWGLGDWVEAKKNATLALKISYELGIPRLIKLNAGSLKLIAMKESNYKEALKMYELFILMRDSINNESTQKAAIRQSVQYEYEKQHLADSLETLKKLALKDIEISKQQAEAKAERTTKYGLYGGLSLVLVIAFVLYRSVQQKKKANDEISLQKLEVEHKNREILDSITYAERIQAAILPPMSLMNEKLKDGFVIYKPKDIVAGDFYWIETCRSEGGDDIFFSAADCTGHGVPGAMMSVMCSNALTKCVKELDFTKPGEILDATTKIIEGRFERSEQLVLDGMDLALCKLNRKSLKLEFAGANNPLWIISCDGSSRIGVTLRAPEVRNDNLKIVEEIRANKQPIGMYDNRMPYTNHIIQLQKGDTIYIFSDGYIDQFGGPKGKKFKSKPFKQLLLSIQNESMDKQKEIIEMAFEDWQGANEQVDDVCIIGVKI